MSSIKRHEWNKTITSSYFQNVKTSSDFVAVWEDIKNLSHQSCDTEPPVASSSSSRLSSTSLQQTSLSNETSPSSEAAPPAKKPKHSHDIDDEIETHKVGMYI